MGWDIGCPGAAPVVGQRLAPVLACWSMSAIRAHVRNGQIVLDEPVELDEGAEVLVFPISDDMDDQERAQLGSMLDESFEDLAVGRTVDGAAYLRELRSRL